ncbi:MAG: ExbD/TolR family protein [Pseudomonadota bacterium]|jgi:biopolymer transport protein TolR|uniref:Biopolymer transport protein ExbD n=1 Tax=anaerobic digester metagenome TaxID=1263854 RepID=A0A485M4U0_9ZZZZ|nr:ExbD/TolR family protein [Pseudomonadota bacterium]HON38080.1 ExbD/TolR family protein [Deltaproteobacteria bacterium]HPD21690.1 ExbD/TolR family protein [Deltaproteobacteria bacterium]HRS56274.1 ExbD/TolR family protein [Desulfomonilia bacterium]HRV36278.1 ExbD/TolR family protein [Desulfomonilia bacterium]
MVANRPGHGKPVSEINVTPLVDVMLVLLIIFMVSAPMMKEGMKVDLPEAEARALQTQTQDLTITINQDRTLDINGSPIDLARLDVILEQIREQRGVESVYLQADKSIPYGYVVEVMSLIRSTGLTKIGLVTQPPTKK